MGCARGLLNPLTQYSEYASETANSTIRKARVACQIDDSRRDIPRNFHEVIGLGVVYYHTALCVSMSLSRVSLCHGVLYHGVLCWSVD